jgi:predicted RNase H-like HicB family nuclease
MQYPIAIEVGSKKHVCGVMVPDLPGCFSAGDTMDEAITNAHEAILIMLETYLDDGKPFPQATSVEEHHKKPEFRGGFGL